MTLTRREFLARTGALAGLSVLTPVFGRPGAAFGLTSPDPATRTRNRLVVIWLSGGNDGLNMVVPRSDVSGAPRYSVYRQVRPTIAYDQAGLLPLDRPGDADHALGFNPKLTKLHDLYRNGRVAVVQGVDYPNHNYSHFTSEAIWEAGGDPDRLSEGGWLGRHLDRAGIGDGELRGVAIGTELPQILKGKERQGFGIGSVPLRFLDGTDAVGDARHAALARYGSAGWPGPLQQYAGDQAETAVSTVEVLETAGAPPQTNNPLANALLTARTLLTQDLGVECVFVHQGGYDTHNAQFEQHERLLTQLDQAVEAFLFGTMGGSPVGVPGIGPLPASVADRTLLVTTSEFGRRIGENATGTDHGAAAPLLVVGPPGAGSTGRRLTPGLHGDHPDMGTTLAPADNLAMTTDLRRVYQAVLQEWLGDPDPLYEPKYGPLAGLFAAGA